MLDQILAFTINIYVKWRFTWRNIKKSYKNKKFKISAPIWNEEFELPDR